MLGNVCCVAHEATITHKVCTHVRKIFGYLRYDSSEALNAMNDLYRHDLRVFQNLFLPSMKLLRKVRVGSKLKRLYDKPQTPLERLLACPQADPVKVPELEKLRDGTDPFNLAKRIEQKLDRIYHLANQRVSPSLQAPDSKTPKPLSHMEKQTLTKISEIFGVNITVETQKITQRKVTS